MFDAEEILQLGKELATLSPAALSEDGLLELAVTLERFSSNLNVARAHVYAELDATGTCFDRHGLKPAGWIAREANSSSAGVRHALKVGRALRNALRDVDDAVIAGDVSFDHAAAIVAAGN